MHYSAIRIRELIEEQGATNRYVATRVGCGETHLSRVLNGHEPVTDSLATEIAKLFRVPVAFLVDAEAVTA